MIKKICFSLISLLFLVLLLTQVLDNFNTASASSIEPITYYQSIKIAKGDTLWSIANVYCQWEYISIDEYIDNVKSINNLKSDRIQAGDYLIVPCYYYEENRVNP